MIKEIRSGETLCALHIAHDASVVGTVPITASDFPLQLLLIQRETGSVFAKHIHKKLERTTNALQESLVVLEGLIRIHICTREGVAVETIEVGTGECFFLVDGGFEIEVVKPTRMYEFKNGPYLDDKVML